VSDAGFDGPDGAGLDARHDTRDAEDGHDAAEAAADVAAEAAETGPTLGGIGDSCTNNAACQPGLSCASVTDLPGLTFSVTSVCSKPCCADTDCGASSVCYPTTGGNLCVSARAAETCSPDCGTPCCGDSDCSSTSKTYCALGTTSAGTEVPSCQPFEPLSDCGASEKSTCKGTSGATCTTDEDCEHGVCSPGHEGSSCPDGYLYGGCQCTGPVVCCSSADCTTHSDTCQWVEDFNASGSPVVERLCQAPSGTTQTGASCTSSASCAGGMCAGFSGQTGLVCTTPCCDDSDCTSAGTGWTCRVFNASLGVGIVPILVCQPPSG
jgi:hypothetical protein